jgi:hypothetical protein
LTNATAETEYPNGLAFSPDERMLYVAITRRDERCLEEKARGEVCPHQFIRAFDVAADGTLRHNRMFAAMASAEDGVSDGMKVDVEGRGYGTGPEGCWVFDASGCHLGIVRLPEIPANCAWGGPDHRTMLFTARTSVYAMRMKTSGTRIPKAGEHRPGNSRPRHRVRRGKELIANLIQEFHQGLSCGADEEGDLQGTLEPAVIRQRFLELVGNGVESSRSPCRGDGGPTSWPVIRNGELMGAVAGSGGTGQQDAACAQAGVAALYRPTRDWVRARKPLEWFPRGPSLLGQAYTVNGFIAKRFERQGGAYGTYTHADP